MYHKVIIKRGREIPLRAGHPWIFSNAIEPNTLPTGPCLVQIFDAHGDFVAIGTYNPLCSISVRVISYFNEKIDEAFFISKIASLYEEKKHYFSADTNSMRVVYADADYLPGLILDLYNKTLVFQIHTAGMELFRDYIIVALKKVFKPNTIIERSDVMARKEEGITDFPVNIHFGKAFEEVVFKENGINFVADVLNGQKTGFFLDQRDSRHKLLKYAKGKNVLNLFSYSGGYSVYAKIAGANHVVSVDISEKALEIARRNYEINGLEVNKECFVKEDVFNFINKEDLNMFDIIICDPPAFAKSKNKMEQATAAYEEINKNCIKKLKKGDIYISSSCSGRLSFEDFRNILRKASGKAGKIMKVLDFCGQPVDHTDNIAFTEGRYLKTYFLECMN